MADAALPLNRRRCERCGAARPKGCYRRVAWDPDRNLTTLASECLVCLNPDTDERELIRREAVLRQREQRMRKVREQSRAKAKKSQARKALQQRARRAKPEAKEKINARGRDYHQASRALDIEAQAAAEMASRVLAQRRLLQFILRFRKDYEPGWVHEDLCLRLERFLADIIAGKSPRLMIFMQPRLGKSTIVSQEFPAWGLGHCGHFEFVVASYALSLPLDFSKTVRARLRDPAYHSLFPTRLRADSRAADHWDTNAGGGYMAVGVGGSLLGKGGHCLVIDDPHKDADEADSHTFRDRVWDWYGAIAKNRLSPGGGILLMMARWHDDDLAGRLLLQERTQTRVIEEQRAWWAGQPDSVEKDRYLKRLALEDSVLDRWTVVSYPAIATHTEWQLPVMAGEPVSPVVDSDTFRAQVGEPAFKRALEQLDAEGSRAHGGSGPCIRQVDEALHPARFNEGLLANLRLSMQPRHWAALYQQNPVPDEGAYFTRAMLRLNHSPPMLEDMRVFAAWDLAIGVKQVNDYTVGVVGGLDVDDQLHVLDVIRGRWGDSATLVDLILGTAQRYRVEVTGIERGQLELVLRPLLLKEQRQRRTSHVFDDSLAPITDKLTRPRPLQGLLQQGRVDFRAGAPWLEDLWYELLRFPSGLHDDMVDALAWLVRLTLKHRPPQRRGAKTRSWRERLMVKRINDPMSA